MNHDLEIVSADSNLGFRDIEVVTIWERLVGLPCGIVKERE